MCDWDWFTNRRHLNRLLTATDMFIESDRRWLLTATDDQFVDRCTIYWQLTVWFWNDDSHCEIREQRPVDIYYYGVGGRIPRTRCLVQSSDCQDIEAPTM